MHIPDGFLDAKTAVATGALATVGVGFALRQARERLPRRHVPLLGLGAAFLFAAQMVNFPVVGGTSGHLVGGALVAVLLGPSAGVIVVTTVLIVQCVLFADGGITALGANVFNMGLVATVGGGVVYRLTTRLLPGLRGRVAAIAFAGWCSIVLAAVACAGQLAWSGTVSWRVAMPAMAGIHALIGLGEGIVSGLVLLAIARVRPDLVLDAAPGSVGSGARPRGLRDFLVPGLLVSAGAALFVAPFASPWPDGLDSVARRLGFAQRASEPVLASPVPEYHMPGIASSGVATALAGLIGVLVVFALAIAFSRIIVREPGVSQADV